MLLGYACLQLMCPGHPSLRPMVYGRVHLRVQLYLRLHLRLLLSGRHCAHLALLKHPLSALGSHLVTDVCRDAISAGGRRLDKIFLGLDFALWILFLHVLFWRYKVTKALEIGRPGWWELCR